MSPPAVTYVDVRVSRHPHPTVLFSLWGYGDLIGDWYSKPSPIRVIMEAR